EHGARNHRVAVVLDAPKLIAGGIVGDHGVGGRADDLLLSSHRYQERRAEGELFERIAWSFGLPLLFTLGLIKRDDELLVAAIAGETWQVIDKNRTAAGTVNRSILQFRVSPDHATVKIETCRALMAKVHVESLAVGDRRRAGVAVLTMDCGGLRAVLRKDF